MGALTILGEDFPGDVPGGNIETGNELETQ